MLPGAARLIALAKIRSTYLAISLGTASTGHDAFKISSLSLAATCPTRHAGNRTTHRTLESERPVPSSLFSPGGEAKCVRGLSVQGARRSARGGVLEQYVEHGEQAQRRNGGPIACFDRQLVRNAGEQPVVKVMRSRKMGTATNSLPVMTQETKHLA